MKVEKKAGIVGAVIDEPVLIASLHFRQVSQAEFEGLENEAAIAQAHTDAEAGVEAVAGDEGPAIGEVAHIGEGEEGSAEAVPVPRSKEYRFQVDYESALTAGIGVWVIAQLVFEVNGVAGRNPANALQVTDIQQLAEFETANG